MKKVHLDKTTELNIYACIDAHKKEILAINNPVLGIRLHSYLLHLKRELSDFYKNCESDLNNPDLQ